MSDRELLSMARSFRKGILGKRPSDMMCFAVCAPLQAYLAIFGVELELVEADFGRVNHVWLALSDGRILDPTADQFGIKPAVYLGPIPSAYETARSGRGER